MASSLSSHFFFFLFSIIAIFFLSSANAAKPRSFMIPAMKDTVKTQYYIKTQLGTPPATLSAIIDLTGQNLFINCDIYNSNSYSPLRCGSAECNAIGDGSCVGCNLPARPGCSNDTCGTYANNPLDSVLLSSGITKDAMVLAASPSPAKLQGFPFACSSQEYMKGLSPSAQGVVGLGSGPMGLTAQLASAFEIDKTISICLPSSVKAAGAVLIGSLASAIKPISLIRTPLVPFPIEVLPKEEYFIGVKSVRISGQVLALNSSLLRINKDGVGGTKLSTANPWTVLHPELYGPIVVGFVRKALAMKLKRVAGVSPFGACFSIESAGKTATGPAVPTIELELESGGEWKIYGANSMVKVNNEVMCLGVVRSGRRSTFGPAILVGAHQLQDNLLELDLGAKTLRFSSSLLAQGLSCSGLPLIY